MEVEFTNTDDEPRVLIEEFSDPDFINFEIYVDSKNQPVLYVDVTSSVPIYLTLEELDAMILALQVAQMKAKENE